MTTSATTHATPRDMGFTERYRVIQSRDRRFDGQFVTAVRSTGIYCRPSCPARTPKEQNVTFFATSAAAHEAGYRACKRCLPEAAPGSPAWDVRGDLAARAMRLIIDGVVDREGVPGLARRLGYSPRHLTRLLTAELGAGPLALARAQRAHTARTLLVGTDLSTADVAFAAGFTSVRQFTDTIGEVFGMPPRDLRARRHRSAGPAPAPGAIDLALSLRGPIDTAGLFGWMRAHAVPGVERGDATSFARVVRLPAGPAWFEVREDAGRLRLRARPSSLHDLSTLIARVRRLFDLDADPLAVDEALSVHPELRGAVADIPGVRVPGAIDADEMLLRAMIGQQISVAAARTMQGRLAAALGTTVDTPDGPMTLFPDPAVIAERGHEVLRGPAARVRAVIAAAAALADGTLALGPGDDRAEQRLRLLALPGIGPWTADYVRMRVLGDPDVLLPGDVAARTGAAALGLPGDTRGFTAWAERTAPWRSYAMAHFWYAAPVTRAWRADARPGEIPDSPDARMADARPGEISDSTDARMADPAPGASPAPPVALRPTDPASVTAPTRRRTAS
ncbi:AraC family transcriptional regulator of adaptative response / DNA-3-methyladenine glycosylase II [Microbacterium sp. AK009]|uniref:DNA-3-methyladenine glycosylase 2 family protein n=1 Tax=Microbacterium sp. AK009 TaxID=2723068 RepID=UPI0018166890|nr:Ada metal-binding domain-containing protein [Microbacterium sp. AK009]NYF15731.1 AraC family transcriptional regulator of adaptative response / DNA-3-methyladenine glycosylase II [Microbacterium sp. AK009]